MPDQSQDLQAWLDALKKRAADQGRGQRAPQPARPAPPPQEVYAQNEEVDEFDDLEVIEEGPARWVDEYETRRQAQQANLRAKAEAEKRKQVEAARRREEADKQQAMERRRHKQQQKEKRRQARQPEVKAKPPKPVPPARSNLGLTGDVVHDVRCNPRSLREAIVLVELLGPPVAFRDPQDRMM